jgi:hypothetical protein
MTTKLPLALALGLAMASSVAQAQKTMSTAVQIEAKRAELEQIQQQLADPDPLRRQAAIMAIVESRDASKIDLALKIALSSDDAAVRGVALRAYMANAKSLRFEVQSPPEIQRQIDAALNGDSERMAELKNRYRYLRAVGDQLTFTLKNYDMSRSTGITNTRDNYNDFSFTVSGDRVSGTGDLFNGITCAFEFQPQKIAVGAPPILKGLLRCNNHSGDPVPRLTITSPLF